jgi:hypothetical protein
MYSIPPLLRACLSRAAGPLSWYESLLAERSGKQGNPIKRSEQGDSHGRYITAYYRSYPDLLTLTLDP